MTSLLRTITATRFDEAVVDADVQRVWALLVDPAVIVRHTPYVRAVSDLGGGRWRWEVGGIGHPGGHFGASFTERMDFVPPHRITFIHEPGDRQELAGADGHYELTSIGDRRARLHIKVAVSARVPVPRTLDGVVAGAMGLVLGRMGHAFATGLLSELEGGSL